MVERQLTENQTFLENLLDSSVCGFYIFDLATMHNTKINKTYTDLLGYTLEDLQQTPDLMVKFHPDDQQELLDHIKDVMESEPGTKHQLEYRFKHKDGHWVWCYSVDLIFERDKQGAPTKMLGTFVDVTDKNDLLIKLQASNDYLEQFAFVASHDLHEPLRKITSFSESIHQRLQSQFESDADSLFELERLKLASKRLSKMIEDLLKLSRINTNSLTLSTEKFGVILDAVMDRLEISLQKTNAQIISSNNDVEVYADVGLFEQLLQNLIANAIKFTRENEPPVINISIVEHETNIQIIVADNGIGIAPEYISRIFEPFKRLNSREKYEGSGIGLAIVSQIVKVHGAIIECDSEEDKGTTFTIQLPKEI